jgi:hypothetical protein
MSLIEFCGFPGSGKSTVGRLLVERLRASGERVVDRPAIDQDLHARYVGATSLGTAAEAFKYGVRRPTWGRALWTVFLQSKSRGTARSIVRIQNQLRASLAFGGAHKLVLDEWFVHQAWLATIESPGVTVGSVQQVIRRIADDLSRVPRLLILLSVSPTVAASRVLSRKEATAFDRFSHFALEQVLTDAHASLDLLCRTSAERSTFVTFDTGLMTPTDVVEELLPQVRALP